MPRQVAHSLEAVLAAIEKGHTVSGAARLLGTSRGTINSYRKRWAAVDKAILDQRDEMLDLAEMGLRVAVQNREAWSIAFTLRTLGKSRGYVERQEHEHSGPGGGPIPIREVVVHLPDEPSNDTLGGEGG